MSTTQLTAKYTQAVAKALSAGHGAIEMDDAKRADCLVKYALHVSRRGTHMAA